MHRSALPQNLLLLLYEPRAQAISAYDGQVEFTAMPKNMLEINIHSIYAEVLTFAKNFGDVRSFAYIEPNGFEAPRFRSEYFFVKSAEKAIAAGTQSVSIFSSEKTEFKCQLSQDAIFISAKEYEGSIVHQTDMEFWRFNQPQGREFWI
ncbi:hypothetical protein D6C90_04614 [Aureobasidium pullulans]|uniref:Uncharacterized protein n=1 Tax=Aureobasidium pullulans TaxID=5580 RepID=A0A4S9V2F3_AURPU|nr:hypothetical protein D6C90_04614 [Aureobasidium pullulans]